MRGPSLDTRHTVIDTDLGPVTLAARGRPLVGLHCADHVRRPPGRPSVPRTER
ncbi:hypothetical protein [Streptomyces sp. NPDC058294]|uniref:hypothetical protein n=1 Tax=Streptomyces sp. NPDC058294 TaxID=3346430 RepID=UPI0036EF87E8